MNFLNHFTFLVLLASTFVAQAIFATTVDKNTWISEYKKAVSSGWCSDPTIAECWPVSEKTCKAEVKTAVESCTKQFESQLPAKLVQPKDGTLWGSKIGSCTGEQYAAALKKSFNKNSKRCLEMDKRK